MSGIWAEEPPPIYAISIVVPQPPPGEESRRDPVGSIALYTSWPMPRPGQRMSFDITGILSDAGGLRREACAEVTIRLQPRVDEQAIGSKPEPAPNGDPSHLDRRLEIGRIEVFVAPERPR